MKEKGVVAERKEPRFQGEVTEKSHKNMSRIKGKDTSIEVTLRRALWNRGYRYRKNCKDLPGRPDIALTKYKIAVFCDGEFFHGKDWEVLKPRLAAFICRMDCHTFLGKRYIKEYRRMHQSDRRGYF